MMLILDEQLSNLIALDDSDDVDVAKEGKRASKAGDRAMVKAG